MTAFLALIAPLFGLFKSGFAWLLKNPMILAIVVLAVIAGVQTTRLAHAKHDLKGARVSLAQCQASTKAQNAAIEAQAAAGRKATADADRALSDARKRGVTVAKEIAQIEAAQPGVDACSAARALILRSTK